jgi:hypothetical protein
MGLWHTAVQLLALSYVRAVIGSSLDPGTRFYGFPHFLKAFTGIVPYNWPWPLPHSFRWLRLLFDQLGNQRN